jgi:hypothetical protein
MDYIMLHDLRMIPAQATREQDDANTIINDDIVLSVDAFEVSEIVEVSERRCFRDNELNCIFGSHYVNNLL